MKAKLFSLTVLFLAMFSLQVDAVNHFPTVKTWSSSDTWSTLEGIWKDGSWLLANAADANYDYLRTNYPTGKASWKLTLAQIAHYNDGAASVIYVRFSPKSCSGLSTSQCKDQTFKTNYCGVRFKEDGDYWKGVVQCNGNNVGSEVRLGRHNKKATITYDAENSKIIVVYDNTYTLERDVSAYMNKQSMEELWIGFAGTGFGEAKTAVLTPILLGKEERGTTTTTQPGATTTTQPGQTTTTTQPGQTTTTTTPTGEDEGDDETGGDETGDEDAGEETGGGQLATDIGGRKAITLYAGQNIVNTGLTQAQIEAACPGNIGFFKGSTGYEYKSGSNSMLYFDSSKTNDPNTQQNERFVVTGESPKGNGVYIWIKEDTCDITFDPIPTAGWTITLRNGQNVIAVPVEITQTAMDNFCGVGKIGFFTGSTGFEYKTDTARLLRFDASEVNDPDTTQNERFVITDKVSPYIGTFVWFNSETPCTFKIATGGNLEAL